MYRHCALEVCVGGYSQLVLLKRTALVAGALTGGSHNQEGGGLSRSANLFLMASSLSEAAAAIEASCCCVWSALGRAACWHLSRGHVSCHHARSVSLRMRSSSTCRSTQVWEQTHESVHTSLGTNAHKR